MHGPAVRHQTGGGGHTLTRRALLRSGGLAGLTVGLPGTAVPRGAPAPVLDRYSCGIAPAARARASTLVAAPFTAALRIPAVLEPVDADATTDRYELRVHPADVEVVAGTGTPMWTYGGGFPGPTIRAVRDRRVLVEVANDLPTPITVHLHGGHVAAADDGHPNDLVLPGARKLYRYPNRQRPATLWYHDHVHHQTAESVYRGLAGLYLLTDPDEDALGLPADDRDLPLVICDRSFAEDGTLAHPGHTGASFFGDTAVVNGVAFPFHEVANVRYRLRLLNASNSRAYRIVRSDGVPLTQIGSDGGLLAAPVERDGVRLHPAERVEVILDLRDVPVGASVRLVDELGARSDGWPGLVRFDVVRSEADGARVPARLRPQGELPAPDRVREVRLQLDEQRDLWVLDGRAYDPARTDQFVRLGATETWRFVNESPVEHPMHPHLVTFRVQGRGRVADGRPLDLLGEDAGWKDTTTVPPGEFVDVRMRFEDHLGTFVYHCHNLEHEDHDMMAQFTVVDLRRLAGATRVDTALAISRARFDAGVPAAYVATAAAFPDALAAGPAAAAQGAPILLTAPDALPAAVAAELQRLAPARIVVLGGPRAVSDAVVGVLRTHTAGPVVRLQGETRYDTAAAVSASYVPERTGVVLVASGAGFADALAGGAAAAALGAGLLLTDPSALPAATAAELRRITPGRVLVAGGAAAVGPSVVAAIETIVGGPVERIGGRDRFETAAALAARAFPDPVGEAWIATGHDFPDALSATPAAAGAPLLTVSGEGVPAPIAAQLRRLRPERIVVLGGEHAVSLAVEDALAAYLPTRPTRPTRPR